VASSLRYCSQVGNIFSASLYLALCSLIDHAELGTPRRIGLFSYGSGCGSEFYSGVVTARSADALAQRRIGQQLAERYKLTFAEYEVIADLAGNRAYGVRDAAFDPEPYGHLYASQFAGQRLLVLDRIDNFHREYRWT
jgi:polyketide biosynthesis 3-hydroxy-3-methylglutaryl-CoA synthase-like enzyme PksG